MVAGDLTGDGRADLAGLNAAGHIFYNANLSEWTAIPGQLSQLVAADLTGDGKADLAGLTANGQIFYSTNLGAWNVVPFVPGGAGSIIRASREGAEVAGQAANKADHFIYRGGSGTPTDDQVVRSHQT